MNEQLTDLVELKQGWYMEADDEARASFRLWLLGVLRKHNPVTVTFTKTDGAERVMNCTLDESIVPKVENPKTSEFLCTVWDTELNQWRSFKFENIKEINFQL